MPTQSGRRAEAPVGSDPSVARAYAELVFLNVIDWYKNADAKAQIILTLDGALIAFLTTSIFKNPAELSLITRSMSQFTWLLLIGMCVCLVISIVSALSCLWSRITLIGKRDSVLAVEKKRIDAGAKDYRAPVMLYFKTLNWLAHDDFQERLRTTDIAFHTDALASQAFLLSGRVYRKHMLVNAGFVFTGASFLLFLASGISYLAALK